MSSFNPLFFENLSIQYDSLLESGQRSDVVLVAGDKELRAHKLVLSTRSPVFSAMFAHDSTKEAQENRVEIVDVDVEVLELFVRYIYTGKVDMLEEYAVELLVIADKYQVASLKTICERQLLSKEITTELASDLLNLADMYQATELIAKCLDFITDNVTRVMATEGWEKVRGKPDLVDDLIKFLNSKYLSKEIDGKKKANLIPRQNTIPFNMASFGSLIFEEMSEQYESLRKSEKQSDVVLVVGDKELKVHKLVLSVRSPVFVTMFENESTKEAQKNRVEIVDIDLEVLEMLVRYIYTGKIEQLDQYTAELLAVADKYQMDCLKTVCEQQLLSQLNVESVSNLLILTDMHQLTEWYNKCVEYITDNATQVIASEGWKKQNIVLRTDLMTNLYEHLHLKYSKVMNVNKKKAELLKKNDEKISGIYRILRPDQLRVNCLCMSSCESHINCDCLKSICEQRLLSQVISTKSVSVLIIFADMHQDIELYHKCIDFIGFNLTHVIATVGWKKILVRADLLTKICKLLDLDFSELLLSPITINSVSNLSILADQPECRKSAFEQQLLSHISTESVSNLLIFADMHQLTELFTRCLYYIIDNGTEVMVSIGWEKILVRADLLAKIYEHLSLKYTRVMDDKCNAQDKYDYDYYDTRNHDSDSDYYLFML